MRDVTQRSARAAAHRGTQRPPVARSAAYNLAGNIAPIVVGFFTIPMTVRGLGVDAFGVLAFAWALLGYFALFDFGLGRATTKFLAEALADREFDRSSEIVWTSVGLSAALGAIGGVILAAAAPYLAGHILKVPPTLVATTRRVFTLLAIAVPAVVISNTLRGVLEADHRFGVVNVIRAPVNTATFAIPAIGVALGWHLPAMVTWLAVTRVATIVPYAWLCLRIVPRLRHRPRFDSGASRALVSYGGWITASNVLGPVLTYLDRFLIGAVLSSAAVAYYAAPYEMVTRLWIFPASLVAALFPAFSVGRDGGKISRLSLPALKYLLLLMAPVGVALVVFAPEILGAWLGADFAVQSAAAFRLLVIGVVLNSIAQVPFSLLQALGRADLPAKFYLAELAVYAPLTWWLTVQAGITGAAGAWTIRVTADAVLMFEASRRISPAAWKPDGGGRGLLGPFVAVGSLAVMSVGVAKLLAFQPLSSQLAALSILFAVFSLAVWRTMLDARERHALSNVVPALTRFRPDDE
jgi:O-antigen/teichoic acid export membrane protein